MGKILLIEDFELFRNSLKKTLSESGTTVLEAANGQEGIQIAFDSIPDIIVVDYVLPDIDGISLINTIKKKCEKK